MGVILAEIEEVYAYIYMPWWTSVIYIVHNFIASSAPKTIHQILYDIQYNISI